MTEESIHIEAHYRTTLYWDMEEIAKSEGFKLEEVESVQVGKWAKLFIDLKNGKTIGIDPPLEHNTDYKWSEEEGYYDKDWNLVEKL
jgi:hypothetical protein